MRDSIALAYTLNLHGIKPESGAPMLLTEKGSVIWNQFAQCWVPHTA